MLPAIRSRVFFPRLANDFFGKDLMSSFFNEDRDFGSPAVNIRENKDMFIVDVAAPGLNKEDFRIELNRNILTISSEKEEKHDEENEQFTRREFSYSSFCRSFSLPDSVDAEKIKANHSNGILSIELPKRDEAKVKPAREISIS